MHVEFRKEASKLFDKAVKLGSKTAYRPLGEIYKNGWGYKKDYEKALSFFKEAVKHGDYECYGSMMYIYSELKQYDNFIKCWDLYIKETPIITAVSCAIYLSCYLMKELSEIQQGMSSLGSGEKSIHLKNIEKMMPLKDGILEELKAMNKNNCFKELLVEDAKNILFDGLTDLESLKEFKKEKKQELEDLVCGKKHIGESNYYTKEELIESIECHHRSGMDIHEQVAYYIMKNRIGGEKELSLHVGKSISRKDRE